MDWRRTGKYSQRIALARSREERAVLETHGYTAPEWLDYHVSRSHGAVDTETGEQATSYSAWHGKLLREQARGSRVMPRCLGIYRSAARARKACEQERARQAGEVEAVQRHDVALLKEMEGG